MKIVCASWQSEVTVHCSTLHGVGEVEDSEGIREAYLKTVTASYCTLPGSGPEANAMRGIGTY